MNEMIRLKLYLTYGLLSSFIGVAIEIAMMVIYGTAPSFYRTFDNMCIGFIIGTVSLSFLFHVFVRLKSRPIIGFLTNFIVTALMIFLFIMYLIVKNSFTVVHSAHFIESWIIILVIVEVLSFALTFAFYRQIILYNKKLELRKASLRDESKKKAI
jgi:hypothetical protein